MFLDFSKAFDKVPHQHLLHKLSYYGITGKTKEWIRGLFDRTLWVCCCWWWGVWMVSCYFRSAARISYGSCLYFSFSLMTSQMVYHQTWRLFVDDSVSYRKITSLEDQKALHEDLVRVFEWAKRLGISFNVNKCVHVTITKKLTPLPYSYTLGGETIPKKQATKYFGITITSDLSWSKHISNIRAKASRTIGLLRRNFGPCHPSVKEKAYYCLMRPQIDYAASVWSPCTQRD